VQASALELRGVTIANTNTPLRAANNTGSGAFTDTDMQAWFNGTGKTTRW